MYSTKRTVKQKRKRWPIAALLVLAVYSSWTLVRPLSDIAPMPGNKQFTVNTGAPKLNWPSRGQSAVAIVGSSILETNGDQKPVPIASTAKVITALAILQKKPLKIGEQGPVIAMTATDVAGYQSQIVADGSSLPIQVGDKLSEYQMIQAIMLPSANNIADTMAIWAFGSLEAYTKAAQSYVTKNGMTATRIGSDASGLSPSTTSTARDLARLGVLAMEHPVLAEIAGQRTAPGAGQSIALKNVNSLLGLNNIIGVKTGNTEEAGGVFISASRVTINNKPVTIVTSVAGSENLFGALKASLGLVQSAQANFSPVTLIRKDDIVARYKQPWGETVSAAADKTLTGYAWNGTAVTANANLRSTETKARANSDAGSITARLPGGTTLAAHIVLQTAASEPSVLWRLTHPF